MPEWNAGQSAVDGGYRYTLAEDSGTLSRGDFLERLAGDAAFADWYSSLLAASPYPACFWENPPLVEDGLDHPAEFVLLEAPALAGTAPDAETFGAHFGSAAGDVVTFRNLGGDALLVVPKPVAGRDAYPHLLAFLRRGPAAQIRELWRVTAHAVRARLGARPLWLSTSGTGVAWLHVRIDDGPKYYQHGPYRRAP